MAIELKGVLCTSGMKGPKGDKGDSYVITEKDYEEIAEKVGQRGVPKGGTTNQILQKKSNDDYDTEWVDNQAVVVQVESVNGKTGKVVLSANDVGATTETWVKQQGYLTEHQDISNLATKQEVTAVEKKIPSLDGYVTETELDNKGYLVNDDISNLASKIELQAVENKIPSLNGYATETYVDNKVDEIDLSPYAKKTEIPTATSQLTNDSGFLTQHQSLDGYAKTTDIPTKVSQLVNDKGYLTEHQSLAEYAKKTEIPTKTSELTNDSGFLTQHQSLAEYAKKTEIPTKVSQLTNDKGYLTEHQDISNLATKTELSGVENKIPTKTSQLTNDSNFLTEHQSLDNYYTKSEVYPKTETYSKVETYTQSEVDNKVNTKSTVSVSTTGTSTNEIKYITIDNTQYKLPTGGSSPHILTGISITTPPTKISYNAGEQVDVTGIEVYAIYADNDNTDITSECTYSPSEGTVIYEDTTSITVSWENEGVTYTTTQAISVTRVLTDIAITQTPTKTVYDVDEALDVTGMIITGIFNSGNTAVVTDYTTDPTNGTVLSTQGSVTLTVTYTENNITKTTTTILTVGVTVADWATGSDEDIVAMVNAANAGKINLSDYWEVGQVRSVSLSAMAQAYTGESHAAQTVDLVLMDTTCDGFTITGTSKKPSFIVGMKNCLNTTGYMNSSSTNSGGWSECARRKWCNNTFYNAIPSTLRPIFKQFTWQTGKGGGSSSGLLSCDDYFAMTPEKAVFGSRSYSFSDETALYNQWQWYQTSSNRIKTVSGSSYIWWECSPYSGDSYRFCFVLNSGGANYDFASSTCGLAPFGCI